MDEKPTTRTSRRALLAAAGGAAAALAAESLARPLSVAANDGDSLKLGQANTADHMTELRCDWISGSTVQAVLSVRGEETNSGVTVTCDHGVAIMAFGTGVDGGGIYTRSEQESGLIADSDSGTGVLARSKTGIALDVEGRSVFKTAGFGTVLKGQIRATVAPSPAHSLNANSKVLVTLMADPKGSPFSYVRVNSGLGTFDVYLTAVAKADTRFAYFVIS